MNEELQKNLFIHQNIENPLYYLTGTLALTIAIIGLVIIIIYSAIKYLKTHKESRQLPPDFAILKKMGLETFMLIFFSAFLCFIISLSFSSHPYISGWAEDAGILLFFPFIAAVFVGGLGKVNFFKEKIFIHSLSFWKVYLFVFLFIGLRIFFFTFLT